MHDAALAAFRDDERPGQLRRCATCRNRRPLWIRWLVLGRWALWNRWSILPTRSRPRLDGGERPPGDGLPQPSAPNPSARGPGSFHPYSRQYTGRAITAYEVEFRWTVGEPVTTWILTKWGISPCLRRRFLHKVTGARSSSHLVSKFTKSPWLWAFFLAAEYFGRSRRGTRLPVPMAAPAGADEYRQTATRGDGARSTSTRSRACGPRSSSCPGAYGKPQRRTVYSATQTQLRRDVADLREPHTKTEKKASILSTRAISSVKSRAFPNSTSHSR